MADLAYWLVPGGFTLGALTFRYPKYRMHLLVVVLVAAGAVMYNMDDKRR